MRKRRFLDNDYRFMFSFYVLKRRYYDQEDNYSFF